MPKINLIRHARTEANEKKQFCGSMQTKVLETLDEIRSKLILKIDVENLGIVYSSPSDRAIFTASAITENILINDDFREIDFGLFEGMTYDEISKAFPEEGEKWEADNMKYVFPNGESIEDFYNRCAKGLDDIIEKNKNATNDITILTHGGVIQAILAYILGDNINLFWQFKVDNCSVTRLDISNDLVVVDFINR